MFNLALDWNPKQARLREILPREDCFEEARGLLYEMHSLVHSAAVYGAKAPTYMDEIAYGLDETAFRSMPTAKDATIAWDIWHITRIEDLTANILIAGGSPVLDGGWLAKLNTSVRDTGNAMTDDEITAFSSELSMDVLFSYRDAVGIRTKEIIWDLKFHDMKRRFTKAQLARIPEEGGLTAHEQSMWLLDFWGGKNVAGILLMPITRHQVVHLNDCRRLKEKFTKARGSRQ